MGYRVMRVHVDYAGPLLGKMFLVLIDAHSKWMEVEPVESATTKTTVDKLRKIFLTHGIPEKLVSDNGAVFTSQKFTDFVKLNEVDHIKTAPYHPSSNGLAERTVQVLKKGLFLAKQGTLTYRLTQVLFSYRITPHSTTEISPAELMDRKLRSRLDLLHTNLEQTVHKKQWQQKYFYKGNRNSMIDLYNEMRVYVRNYNKGVIG